MSKEISFFKKIVMLYGFQKPYDFSRAMLAILGLVGLFALTIFACVLYARQELRFGTPRADFFVYVSLIIFVGLITVKWKKISSVLIFYACIEFFLACLGYALFFGFGFKNVMLPAGDDYERLGDKFKFHNLLMAVPSKNYSSKQGIEIVHDKHGRRGIEKELIPSKKILNVYGGSTTYDIAVPQRFTWPEVLEENLGKEWQVFNYGVPGYSTAEHVIQTAFYAYQDSVKPDCSVYYIGWNDIRNYGIDNIDPAYSNFHIPSQTNNLLVKRKPWKSFSPMYSLIYTALNEQFDTIKIDAPKGVYVGPSVGSSFDPKELETIYRNNIRTLAYINSGRGVRTVFVGQVLNPHRLTKTSKYGWLPMVPDIDVWPLQKYFNNILIEECSSLNLKCILLDEDMFSDSDFVDNGHFSVVGSRKFADLLYKDVLTLCKK